MKRVPPQPPAALPSITVTCRCTRTMRQEPGRRAGYLACSCGTKVRVDSLQGKRCGAQGRDGELCPHEPVLTSPVTLCRRHVDELATTPAFSKSSAAELLAAAYNRAHGITMESARQKQIRQHREWAYEENLRKAELRKQSQVYYIALRNCIKIGYTTNMQARMNQLMPDAVLATEPGDETLERQRHLQFKHLKANIGSEYFKPSQELKQHIEKVLADHGAPKMTGYPDYDSWHLGERLLVPVKDAASICGVGLRTVYDWASEGRLTVTRPEGKKRGTLVNAKEVEQLVELRRRGRLPRLDRAA